MSHGIRARVACNLCKPTDSKRVRVNAKYTHHSCALGPDDRQYDAVGVELEWKVWER